MPESHVGHFRWAIYAPRAGGAGWTLRGIYPTQGDADTHGRPWRPRVIVPIALRGRPPERFADLAALERWFGIQGP